MSPYISVLVIAHRRTQYINHALESLCTQTLDRRLFEIILVSNIDIDNEVLRRSGARLIRTDRNELEVKIAIGLDYCSGEVISLLEDDDVWEDGKLQAVYDLFTEREDVGYYHNSYSLIGEDGQPMVHPMFRLMEKRMDRVGALSVCGKAARFGVIRKMIKVGMSFNTSCMSIRKGILQDRTDYLVTLNAKSSNVDNFLFFAALLSGKQLYGDSRRLTRYRVHPENSSKKFLSVGITPEALGYGVLLRMVGAGKGDGQIRKSVESMISDLRFEIYSREGLKNRGMMLSAIVEHLRYFSLYDFQYDVLLLLFGLLYFISPRLGSMMHSIPGEHLT